MWTNRVRALSEMQGRVDVKFPVRFKAPETNSTLVRDGLPSHPFSSLSLRLSASYILLLQASLFGPITV